MNDIRALQTVVAHLERAESDIRNDQASSRAYEKRASRLIHSLYLVIGSMALINLYFVGDLAQEVQVIIRSMNKMYTQFGQMSERMHGMRYHVSGMGEQMALMPVMVEQMGSISGQMSQMEQEVTLMRGALIEIGDRVHSIGGDIGVMDRLFYEVNGKVFRMRHNVGQMSRMVP